MKKILFLVFMIFLLSGCSAQYNLIIDNEEIIEKLNVENVTLKKSDKLLIPVKYNIDDPEAFEKKINGIDYYNVKKDEGKNNYQLNYKFSSYDFSDSRILNGCYDKVESLYNGSNYIISTIGSFTCFETYDKLEDIQIKITSHYKLVETNADKIEGNNYYWNINKSNIEKGIYIELDTSVIEDSLKDVNLNNKALICIIIALIIIAGIIAAFIKKIINKNNYI